MIFIKRQYNEAYRLVRQQQDELLIKNERISNINSELEKKVDQRTHELLQHQEKLLRYAFFHSHDLRAPITNLLTIHEALQLDNLSDKQKDGLIEKLHDETERLDQKIKEVQKTLENSEYSSAYHQLLQEQTGT
jgi:K+-sensing histidine kinase KdpD